VNIRSPISQSATHIPQSQIDLPADQERAARENLQIIFLLIKPGRL
jgi:hypothetical protein